MQSPLLPEINNGFYDDLGDKWYTDNVNPIALLRAESALKLEYVHRVFQLAGVEPRAQILDVGCGGGLLANPLAQKGYLVRGIDLSASSLQIARARAPATDNPVYETADAYQLPFAGASYDAVLMLDFLEHVSDPEATIKEAARVLRPGGVFIFHTFNRNLLSRLLVIKAVEIFSRDCPRHMHVYHLFIKPEELVQMCRRSLIKVGEMLGSRPQFFSWAFLWTLLRRRLHPDFKFVFTQSLALGYLGYGRIR